MLEVLFGGPFLPIDSTNVAALIIIQNDVGFTRACLAAKRPTEQPGDRRTASKGLRGQKGAKQPRRHPAASRVPFIQKGAEYREECQVTRGSSSCQQGAEKPRGSEAVRRTLSSRGGGEHKQQGGGHEMTRMAPNR